MARLTDTRLLAACAAISLLGVSETRAQAAGVEDRAHRLRCAQAERRYGAFDVPVAYQQVSEPGGIVEIRKADGTPWRPAPADVQRLGATIETNPTDSFAVLPLTQLHPVPVDAGTIYSRVDCDGLDCLFKVAFVPSDQANIADECGVAPRYLRIDGVSEDGLAAARRAIRFRWGSARNALSLADFVAGR